MATFVLKINGKEVEVEEGSTVIQACEKEKIDIPTFCYHEKLKIAGNCRMCMVEIKPSSTKPVPACATPVSKGMEIFTDTEMVKKARHNAMEFLLANHPLDCPVCDQAGECHLQENAFKYGKCKTRFNEEKRIVKDKYLGPLIETNMTRCIHCTRCIRFCDDVAGISEIGAINRGIDMEITTMEKAISSELSGNLIDLCPVGALTSKPNSHKFRPWELRKIKTIELMDAMCCDIEVHSKRNEIMRIVPCRKEKDWISDKARFAFDGLQNNRIKKSFIYKNKNKEEINEEEALEKLSDLIKKSKEKTAIITGKFCDLETQFFAKKLIDKLESKYSSGSEKDIDINSESMGNYLFNVKFNEIEKVDLILIIACNLRKDCPTLNAKIREISIKKNTPIYVIDEERNLTYKAEYLENKISTLTKILNGKNDIAKKIKIANNPIMIVGEDLFKNEDSKDVHNLILSLAEKYFIKKDWNGFCFVPKYSSTIGSFAIGFSSVKASEILKSIEKDEINLLILIGTDEINISKISKSCKIIYIGSHLEDNHRNNIDLFIATKTLYEKEGFYIDLFGNIVQTHRCILNSEVNFTKSSILKSILLKLNLKNDDILFDLKNINVEKKIKLSKFKEISDFEIKSEDYNYYLTDFISKNSINMQNCSKEILI